MGGGHLFPQSSPRVDKRTAGVVHVARVPGACSLVMGVDWGRWRGLLLSYPLRAHCCTLDVLQGNT